MVPRLLTRVLDVFLLHVDPGFFLLRSGLRAIERRPATAPEFSKQPERWESPPASPPEGRKLILNPNKEVWRRRLDRGSVEMSKQPERWPAVDESNDHDGYARTGGLHVAVPVHACV